MDSVVYHFQTYLLTYHNRKTLFFYSRVSKHLWLQQPRSRSGLPVIHSYPRFSITSCRVGRSEADSDELRPFFRRKEELSVEDGCILWGHRVVIPLPGREKIVELLHESHPGMTRIKGIARSYVWWPGLDDVLEKKVRHCQSCQEHQRLPSKAPLHPWEFPERPWSRLHIDFAGPFLNKQFLLIVDAHSKWLEVFIVPTTSSQAAINKLRPLFATHGLPELLVSDNGAAFTSDEFSEFTKKNGIRHTTSAPYHPSSNAWSCRTCRSDIQASNEEV